MPDSPAGLPPPEYYCTETPHRFSSFDKAWQHLLALYTQGKVKGLVASTLPTTRNRATHPEHFRIQNLEHLTEMQPVIRAYAKAWTRFTVVVCDHQAAPEGMDRIPKPIAAFVCHGPNQTVEEITGIKEH